MIGDCASRQLCPDKHTMMIITSSANRRQHFRLKVISSIILAAIAIHWSSFHALLRVLSELVSNVPNVPRVKIHIPYGKRTSLFGELSLGHSSGLNTHYPSKQAGMLAEMTLWSRIGTFVFTLNKWTALGRRVSKSWCSVLWALVWKYLPFKCRFWYKLIPSFQGRLFFWQVNFNKQ